MRSVDEVFPGRVGVLQFHSTQFRGTVQGCGDGHLSFQHCTFDDPVSIADGSVTVVDSDFAFAGQHLRLGPGVLAASLVSNRFAGSANIRNEASSKQIRIDHTPLKFEPLPPYRNDFSKECKPARRALYVATAPAYGARDDAMFDSTAAIQKALDAAAAAGGGIVFLPGGEYRLQGNLTVPSGVELRGVFDVPHHSEIKGSTLMIYCGKGQEKGPPAIAVHARGGVRGLLFCHPEQITHPLTPFPYVLQGQGADIYLVNITAVCAYQYVDLFTYRCDRHWLDYVVGDALKNAIHIGGGSVDGVLRNTMLNHHYWYRSPFGNKYFSVNSDIRDLISKVARDPKRRTVVFGPVGTFIAGNYDGMILGDCRNETSFMDFVIHTNRGLVLARENGKGPSGIVIGYGGDWCQTGVAIEGVGADGLALVNTELVAQGKTPNAYIECAKDLAGKVTFFNTSMWGIPAEAVVVRGGTLNIQQACSTAPAKGSQLSTAI